MPTPPRQSLAADGENGTSLAQPLVPVPIPCPDVSRLMSVSRPDTPRGLPEPPPPAKQPDRTERLPNYMRGRTMSRTRVDRAAMNAGTRLPKEGVDLVSTYGDIKVSQPQS